MAASRKKPDSAATAAIVIGVLIGCLRLVSEVPDAVPAVTAVAGIASAVASAPIALAVRLAESGAVPDVLLRAGIRFFCRQRLAEITKSSVDEQRAYEQAFVDELRSMNIAQNQSAANEQHYEVDSRFYTKVLGGHLKYSSALYPEGTPRRKAAALLSSAEEAMLDLYVQRAQLSNTGQQILDLGCGWGSVSLYVAERFPRNKVVGLSNSRSQRAFIMKTAKARGITNLKIVTADISETNIFAKGRFDRVISIEMFEHMKNYEKLLNKVSSWMAKDALLFIHIFTCKQAPYHFIPNGESDWMAKFFFTGGTMPSDQLLTYFQDDVSLISHWRVPGTHYQLTSEAWLQRMDAARDELWPVLTEVYGEGEEKRWFMRWRIFFLAVAEMFGLDGGQSWFVSHYLFKNK